MALGFLGLAWVELLRNNDRPNLRRPPTRALLVVRRVWRGPLLIQFHLRKGKKVGERVQRSKLVFRFRKTVISPLVRIVVGSLCIWLLWFFGMTYLENAILVLSGRLPPYPSHVNLHYPTPVPPDLSLDRTTLSRTVVRSKLQLYMFSYPRYKDLHSHGSTTFAAPCRRQP